MVMLNHYKFLQNQPFWSNHFSFHRSVFVSRFLCDAHLLWKFKKASAVCIFFVKHRCSLWRVLLTSLTFISKQSFCGQPVCALTSQCRMNGAGSIQVLHWYGGNTARQDTNSLVQHDSYWTQWHQATWHILTLKNRWLSCSRSKTRIHTKKRREKKKSKSERRHQLTNKFPV